MTHPYKLHEDIQAQCLCCRALQPFNFASASDQVVCSFCARHVGSEKAERRDGEHLTMWVGLLADEQEAHRDFVAQATETIADKDRIITELTGQVDELRGLVAGKYEQTGVGGVRGLLENDLIKRAERKAELAGRRIDWSMAVLWRIGILHHDDKASPGRCVCGRSSMDCPEGKAIDPLRQAVRDWEKKNLQLLADGKRHGLPDDHPQVISS